MEKGEGRQPVARRNPGILYGLGNLIENAIDFAAAEVRIVARWNASSVKLVIEDDGPGFSPDVIGRIGAPYVTTKTNRRAKSEDGAGLGLGLFIAKTLLERSGAVVATANVLRRLAERRDARSSMAPTELELLNAATISLQPAALGGRKLDSRRPSRLHEPESVSVVAAARVEKRFEYP